MSKTADDMHALQEENSLLQQHVHELEQQNGQLQHKVATLEKQVAAYENEAIRDPETGLFNQHYMHDALGREVSRAFRHEYSIGVILVHLSNLNDVLHTYGDQQSTTILRAISMFLRAHIRNEDILCRYGADMFSIIMGQATLENTEKRAQELSARIGQLKMQLGSQEVENLSLSAGVASFPNNGATSETVMKSVEQALEQARAAGPGSVQTAERASRAAS